MRDLHESVAHTAKEMIIKESEGFRLRLEKFECLKPTPENKSKSCDHIRGMP